MPRQGHCRGRRESPGSAVAVSASCAHGTARAALSAGGTDVWRGPLRGTLAPPLTQPACRLADSVDARHRLVSAVGSLEVRWHWLRSGFFFFFFFKKKKRHLARDCARERRVGRDSLSGSLSGSYVTSIIPLPCSPSNVPVSADDDPRALLGPILGRLRREPYLGVEAQRHGPVGTGDRPVQQALRRRARVGLHILDRCRRRRTARPPASILRAPCPWRGSPRPPSPRPPRSFGSRSARRGPGSRELFRIRRAAPAADAPATSAMTDTTATHASAPQVQPADDPLSLVPRRDSRNRPSAKSVIRSRQRRCRRAAWRSTPGPAASSPRRRYRPRPRPPRLPSPRPRLGSRLAQPFLMREPGDQDLAMGDVDPMRPEVHGPSSPRPRHLGRPPPPTARERFGIGSAGLAGYQTDLTIGRTSSSSPESPPGWLVGRLRSCTGAGTRRRHLDAHGSWPITSGAVSFR